MPGAAVPFINAIGSGLLTIFGGTSAAATAMAARTAEIPMKADPVSRPDNGQILADMQAGNQARLFEGFDASRRLLGPIVTVWTCLEAAGLAPGPRGDDIVLVRVRGWYMYARHVATVSLAPQCATVQWALAETERVTASIPVGWQAEQARYAARAIKELADREHVDRREYPSWLPPDDHFWNAMSRQGMPIGQLLAGEKSPAAKRG